AAALEIATRDDGDVVELILVGFDGSLDRLERVETVEGIEAVIDRLERRDAEVRSRLVETGHASVVAARIAGHQWGEWTPTVAICAQPLDEASVGRLAEIADGSPQAIITVVAPAPFDRARQQWTAGEHLVVEEMVFAGRDPAITAPEIESVV